MEVVNTALQQYGANLNVDNYITRGDKILSVKAVVKGKRLRFESSLGLIASGNVTEAFVCSFVERYWFWTKAA